MANGERGVDGAGHHGLSRPRMRGLAFLVGDTDLNRLGYALPRVRPGVCPSAGSAALALPLDAYLPLLRLGGFAQEEGFALRQMPKDVMNHLRRNPPVRQKHG